MADTSSLPEPDQVPGAPHPRETEQVFGHHAAIQEFLDAYQSDRLHHGWLISGPKGIGKATLAWSIARFLLATPPQDDDGLFGAPPPPETLDIDPEHPVARRMLALSEPGLFLLRRTPTDKGDKFASEIRVGDVRKLKDFFNLSASDGGRRVVIVDCADEMNPNAANALLKLLEEPPERSYFLLIAHQPSRLLPTIRSRCRTLRLFPLGLDDLTPALNRTGADMTDEDIHALNGLTTGSVGEALRLHNLDGIALYSEILGILRTFPQLDHPRLLALANSCAGRGKEDRLDLLLTLTDQICARLARRGVCGTDLAEEVLQGEAQILQKLAPNAASGRNWASLAQKTSDRARHARSVNVDPAAIVTDLFIGLKSGFGG